LPKEPACFYKDFTNIPSELGFNRNRRRWISIFDYGFSSSIIDDYVLFVSFFTNFFITFFLETTGTSISFIGSIGSIGSIITVSYWGNASSESSWINWLYNLTDVPI
jgi:hypothetical protein